MPNKRKAETASLHEAWIEQVAEQAARIPVQRYLTCTLTAALLLVRAPGWYPVAWWLLVISSLALRTAGIAALAADDRLGETTKLRRIGWLYWISGAAQATVLGFFPELPMTLWGVITVYLVASCSAALHGLAGYRPVFLPYCLLTLGASTLAWMLVPALDAFWFERLVFAGLGLVLLTTLLSQAEGSYALFSESWNIRQQRIALNHRLGQALDGAEAANVAKSRFLAAASHDLRQPIHALSLFTATLRRRPLDVRTAGIAAHIDQAVQSLTIELDALLDISRLEADALARSRATVELYPLLSRLSEEVAMAVARKQLQLVLNGSPGIWVRTNPELLQRIVRNLLANAVKYTVHGRVEIFVDERAGMVCVGVSDTGPGIPPQEQGHIFDEFYRVEGTAQSGVEGCGLGLAIVRRLSTLIGLDLQMESRLGRGSRFWVELPAAEAPPPPPPSIAAALGTSLPGAVHVLVVDDEPAPRFAAQILLEDLGFNVRVADGIGAALAAALRHPPDLLLTDLRLRDGEDGLALLARLRERQPGLAAIVLSGDTSAGARIAVEAAGVELLHKPVQPLHLQDAVGRAICRFSSTAGSGSDRTLLPG